MHGTCDQATDIFHPHLCIQINTSDPQSSPTSVNDIVDTATTAHVDQAKAEAFSSHERTLVDHDVLILMIFLGNRTGLLEFSAAIPATSSAEFAKAANLYERYDCEWSSNIHVRVIFPLHESSRLTAAFAAVARQDINCAEYNIFLCSLFTTIRKAALRIFCRGQE